MSFSATAKSRALLNVRPDWPCSRTIWSISLSVAGSPWPWVGDITTSVSTGRSATCPLFSGNGTHSSPEGRALNASWTTCLTRSSMSLGETPERRSVSSLFRFGLMLNR